MKQYRSESNPNIRIRFAAETDTALVLSFIRALAEYEHMEPLVTATEESLREALFRRKGAEVILAEKDGEPVGFSLFFHNFSTFLGKPGLYLEDLFVLPKARGEGIGRLLLAFLAKLAVERGCGRFEWSCLDWNTPSIAFYRKMGAKAMDEWTTYRADGEALSALAQKF